MFHFSMAPSKIKNAIRKLAENKIFFNCYFRLKTESNKFLGYSQYTKIQFV